MAKCTCPGQRQAGDSFRALLSSGVVATEQMPAKSALDSRGFLTICLVANLQAFVTFLVKQTVAPFLTSKPTFGSRRPRFRPVAGFASANSCSTASRTLQVDEGGGRSQARSGDSLWRANSGLDRLQLVWEFAFLPQFNSESVHFSIAQSRLERLGPLQTLRGPEERSGV